MQTASAGVVLEAKNLVKHYKQRAGSFGLKHTTIKAPVTRAPVRKRRSFVSWTITDRIR